MSRYQHFQCLEREDLRVHRSESGVVKTLFPRPESACLGLSDGDEVMAVCDEDGGYSTFRAVVADYDYCSERGASWWLVPIAFGPVREGVA